MIRLVDVCKSYGHGRPALRDVSLVVEAGEMVLLTGPSGAGKTTLLRLLYAAERPDRGQVYVAGRDVSMLRRSAIPYLRRNIGVVFQDFKLMADRSAYANVVVVPEILGMSRRAAWRATMGALMQVGLGDRAAVPVAHLSGGEQQRVALARAWVGAPPILLCDEPTGNLDPERARSLLGLLDTAHAGGTTVVLATHDPLVVSAERARRRIRLDAGVLVSEAPAEPRHAPIPVPA
jgi:cell division transport system ATP-binding protein